MKNHYLLALALLALVFQTRSAFGQGSLTPPGAPVPTMKTLSQIEPRTPISSLPYTISIPGSYYVTTNLSSSSSGITITAGNVVLDLNGFSLTGGSQTGVLISGSYTNITVRNGTVANWASRGVDGYNSGSPRNTLYDDLTVSGNGGEGISADTDSVIRNCRVYGNGGFEGVFSHGGQITDCVARGNAGFGIFGYNCIIRNCHCENNTGGGIDCNAGSVLDSSAINNTSYGIRLYGGGSARRCHVQGNGSAGIYTLNNSPVLGGVIADCTVATNNNYGISLVGFGYLVTGNQVAYNLSAGIAVQSSNNRIDGNQILVAASAYGIQISSLNYTNNVIVRNSVYGSGNSANNYNITGTGNDVGPIGNASTNTSPWANFSH